MHNEVKIFLSEIGKKGGKASLQTMTKEARSQRGVIAASKRWENHIKKGEIMSIKTLKIDLWDWYIKTQGLTLEEEAIYLRLVRGYYWLKKPLFTDIERLKNIAKSEKKDIIEQVLNQFFTLKDDGWHDEKIDTDIKKYLERKDAKEERRIKKQEQKQ